MKKLLLCLILLFTLSACVESTTMYTVSINFNNGSNSQYISIEDGNEIPNIATPTREGYTFGGWFYDNDFNTPLDYSTLITENISLYANWSIDSYKVRFFDFDNHLEAEYTFEYGSSLSGLEIPVMTREGYTFTGWDNTIPESMPDHDIALTSVYEIITIPSIYDYLGETLPTNRLVRFDPVGYVANSTWFWHGAPVFSPDGNEMYFGKIIEATETIEIWYTKKVDDVWVEARKFEVEGITGATNCPVFTDNPNNLYFINFTLEGIFNIVKVERVDGNWENPTIIDIPLPEDKSLAWTFSIAENMNMYFALFSISGSEIHNIYMSEYVDGIYTTPIAINEINDSTYGANSAVIAPDESYVIFESVRPGGYGMHDLYISFRDEFGNFTTPINLGSQINANREDGGSRISADGLYLFFTTEKIGDRGYNPYWIKLDEIAVIRNH